MINYFRKLFGHSTIDDSIIKYEVDNSYNEVFSYEYIFIENKVTDDYIIRFLSIKNVDQLIARLLLIVKQIGFEVGPISNIMTNDEMCITIRTPKSYISITRDIYDFVHISANQNKSDLDLVEQELNKSVFFERKKQ